MNQAIYIESLYLIKLGVEYLVAHWAHNPVERVRSPPSSATESTVPNFLSFFEVFINEVEFSIRVFILESSKQDFLHKKSLTR
jgi:hypothetical protein